MFALTWSAKVEPRWTAILVFSIAVVADLRTVYVTRDKLILCISRYNLVRQWFPYCDDNKWTLYPNDPKSHLTRFLPHTSFMCVRVSCHQWHWKYPASPAITSALSKESGMHNMDYCRLIPITVPPSRGWHRLDNTFHILSVGENRWTDRTNLSEKVWIYYRTNGLTDRNLL